jgi:predicted RNA binding protein YcfA (HicA-like mRNA interferase family)
MVTEALELWFEDTPVPDHFSRPVVTTVDLHLIFCMSQSFPAVTGREVLKALVGVGFVHVSTKGSHATATHPDGRVAVVPMHGGLVRLWDRMYLPPWVRSAWRPLIDSAGTAA